MKKLILSLFLGLLAVSSLLTAKVVLAHHNTITQTASCEGYLVKADYVGGSSTRRVLTDVDFTLDGVLENINSDWRGTSGGFNIFTRTGTGSHDVQATGTVKMYSCEGSNDDLWTQSGVVKCDASGPNFSDDGWDLVETDTFNLNFDNANCQPPVIDVCPNLEGDQETLPEGYHYDNEENCVPNVVEEPEEPEVPVRVETPLTQAGTPSCPNTAPTKVPNIFVTNAGIGALEVRWIPTGGNFAHILYGFEAGKPLYSLLNTPNDGVEVINLLNSGSHYWFSVVNGEGCAWSQLSDWFDPVVQ